MNDTAWNKIKARIEQPDCQMGDVKYPLSGEYVFVTPEAMREISELPPVKNPSDLSEELVERCMTIAYSDHGLTGYDVDGDIMRSIIGDILRVAYEDFMRSHTKTCHVNRWYLDEDGEKVVIKVEMASGRILELP